VLHLSIIEDYKIIFEIAPPRINDSYTLLHVSIYLFEKSSQDTLSRVPKTSIDRTSCTQFDSEKAVVYCIKTPRSQTNEDDPGIIRYELNYKD